MEKKEPKKIGFSIKYIKTEQFAINEEVYQDDDQCQLTISTKFAVEKENRVFAVYTSFQINFKDSLFLKLDSICDFEVEENSWNSMVDGSQITFPKNFACHLTTIAVGTARGILHAKTENTRYNKFIIPTINVMELIKTDISIPLDDIEQ